MSEEYEEYVPLRERHAELAPVIDRRALIDRYNEAIDVARAEHAQAVNKLNRQRMNSDAAFPSGLTREEKARRQAILYAENAEEIRYLAACGNARTALSAGWEQWHLDYPGRPWTISGHQPGEKIRF